MRELLLENFRCFRDPGPIPLRPVTLLVGDNSTGKTSLLAACRLLHGCLREAGGPIDFNEEPFLLGNFNDMAHQRSKRAKAASFSIGESIPITFDDQIFWNAPDVASSFETVFVFGSERSLPKISRINHSCGPFSITGWVDEAKASPYPMGFIQFEDENGALPQIPTEKNPLHRRMMQHLLEQLGDSLHHVEMLGTSAIGFHLNRSEEALKEFDSNTLLRIRRVISVLTPVVARISGFGDEPIALAPIRTRARRTYDSISDVPDPEGTHIPLILARIYDDGGRQWDDLSKALNAFGKDSGLFHSFEVKQWDAKAAGPFQIRVNYGGPAFNLADVGYGVSQSLPIVVESVRSAIGTTHLIQQPEVHLHPRAQAALGTVFATLAAKQNKQFIIETHSDHLLDRVRMEARKGKTISHEDVVILYFERVDGSRVDIHPIFIDEDGDLLDPPESYRSFFLQERLKLLGAL